MVLLGISTATLGVFQAKGVSAKDLKKAFAKPPEEQYLQPYDILTNADINGDSQMVKTKIIVSTLDEEVIKDSEKYNYKIKELLIDYINGQKVEKLRDASKKELVKKEILASLEKELPIKLKSVYFVDFLVE